MIENTLFSHMLELKHTLVYMYEQDLSLNNLQWLIGRKTKPNLT